MRYALPISLALCLLLIPGCKRYGAEDKKAREARQAEKKTPKKPPVTAEQKKAAQELFAMRCSACHGQDGKGTGPTAKGFNPPPADFTSAEWQKSVTDEHIELITVKGGVAVGKSSQMPPNPDLSSRPGVVRALRLYIRDLKGK